MLKSLFPFFVLFLVNAPLLCTLRNTHVRTTITMSYISVHDPHKKRQRKMIGIVSSSRILFMVSSLGQLFLSTSYSSNQRRKLLSPHSAVVRLDDENFTTEISRDRRVFMKRMLLSGIVWTNSGLVQGKTAYASIVDARTGIVLPSEGEIEISVPQVWDEADNPFESMGRDKFSRLDMTPDSIFYSDPVSTSSATSFTSAACEMNRLK